MRLDYFIANATDLSRKEARQAITKGRVQRNNEPCRKASVQVLPLSDTITLDSQTLSLPGERYLMLFKPEEVISATTDSQQPTALDLLPPDLRKNLHIAGRLDRDTTGLLLLTTDGQWSHRITSPRSECFKTYRVGLSEPIDQQAISTLEIGVDLRNEATITQPAKVRLISACEIELTISEGRYHQIKRMMAAIGNHVVTLHRQQVGKIVLDPALAPGDYRELTSEEINSVI